MLQDEAYFQEWRRARNEALLSLDLDKINAHQRAYGGLVIPDSISGWAGVHKARSACLDLPDEERQKSRDWLAAHHMRPLE